MMVKLNGPNVTRVAVIAILLLAATIIFSTKFVFAVETNRLAIGGASSGGTGLPRPDRPALPKLHPRLVSLSSHSIQSIRTSTKFA